MSYDQTSAGYPVLQDKCGITGMQATGVRRGFTDHDVWGRGRVMACTGDCLDAPAAIPTGSTRGHYFTDCVGGVGPRSTAFVTQLTRPVSVYGDRA